MLHNDNTLKNKVFCFVLNSSSFFLSHRLPIAKKLIDLGATVYVLTPNDSYSKEINESGATHIPVSITRSGKNIFKEAYSLISIAFELKKLNPDIVHFVTIKPVIYGGIVSRILGINNVVFAISGLGLIFSSNDFKTKVLRFILSALMKNSLAINNSRIIFQNDSDRSTLLKIISIEDCKSIMIRGSGVNLNEFIPSKLNETKTIITFAGRLLKSKGIILFLEMASEIKKRHPSVVFNVLGAPDPLNPDSISFKELEGWKTQENVNFLGFKKNIVTFLKKSSVFVFPSFYGEGVPKVLLEAAACGNAIVTTNHPGCKDAIIEGSTGMLVEPKSVDELIYAVEYLINSKDVLDKFCIAARELAESKFDVKDVVDKHINIYEEILDKG